MVWIGEYHIHVLQIEPFGYGIFEWVDRGKLPIIHRDWCIDLDYPYIFF